MNADFQQQFLRDMVTESGEGLDQFDRDLLTLEGGGADPELLHSIFRVVHTLKGTAGCLGFRRIQDVAHAGENVLDLLRGGQLSATPACLAALFALSDTLRAELAAIEETGKESAETHEDLILCLGDIAAGRAPAEEGRVAAPADAPAPAADEGEPLTEALDTSDNWGLFDDDEEATPEPAEEAVPAAENMPAGSTGEDENWGLFSEEESAESVTLPGAPDALAPEAASAPGTPPVTARRTSRGTTVRVDVDLLDRLMNLAGELVLARNQLGQAARPGRLDESSIQQVSQRLNHITSDLQEGIMKTRMQPIGTVWGQFPRIVRDVATGLGKQVRLELVGETTELDRTILEAIRDPLTHLIRNAVDHGVESPEARAAAGKPTQAHLVMRAFHEGGQVNIEIIDDGAGVRLDKVRARALERGLIRPEEADRLSERELVNLIFSPGFSTAETVTDVSGRGVGMDVVRTNIEKIGGSVDLQTTAGAGTTVKIRIPLTLAIIPALIVRVEERRFAVPQVNLLELVRLAPGDPQGQVEEVYGQPVFRLRGRLLPLVSLRSELGFPPAAEGAKRTIVVVQADGDPFGLVVDAVCDTEEIVVKPLSRQLKGLAVFAGATIMGDGQVALILDVLGLAARARLEKRAETLALAAGVESEAAATAGEASQLLLFSLPGRPHLAVPLDQAARLEQFPASALERAGEAEAVQYRGAILPILRLAQALPGVARQATTVEPPDLLDVIVCRVDDQLVGVVVDAIHDILETEVRLQPESEGPGILGSAIIAEHITDLVNLPSVLAAFNRRHHRRAS
ncbi:MAG: chemotaxis protein CheA [Opitutales bacterium]